METRRFGSPFSIFILGICFLKACESASRAHHKVHNLALYPERHSWCQATPIRQEIAHAPECSPKTIDNVVCLGACFSYSVPRAQDDAVKVPPYCDACRPIRTLWTTVTLNCTKAVTGELYHVAKNVELISNCSCVDCNDNSPRDFNNEISGDSVEDSLSLENLDALDLNDLEEDDDDKSEPDDIPLPDIPTLHKLKSASAEMKGFPKVDKELMIKDNKINPDDRTVDNHHKTEN
jgi:neuroblastoma suppressor of tumorigenicity 1